MKRRIFTSMVGVAALAVLLFAVPLAVAAERLEKSHQITRLQRAATRAAESMPEAGLRGSEPITIPNGDGDLHLALYDAQNFLVVGEGPTHGGRDVISALSGRVADTSAGGWISAAVPLRDEDRTVGAARAAVPADNVSERVVRAWATMTFLALAAVGIAAALARWQARSLSAPVRDLTLAAERLGQGEFTVQLGRYGIEDMDRAAQALKSTAATLGKLLQRERGFSSDASHQLRTPLTTMRLELENALEKSDADRRAAIQGAVAEIERLQRTVHGLLALTRDRDSVSRSCAPAELCRQAADRWRRILDVSGRSLVLDLEPQLRLVRCSEDALRETLQVLLDNSVKHGQGTVTLRARHAGDGVVLEVEDEGDGIHDNPEALFQAQSPTAEGHGIGLALARTLMEAEHARLTTRRSGTRSIFVVALPGVKQPSVR